MICNFSELRNKEVINKIDGARLGSVCDFEVDTETGKMKSLIVLGKGRLFSAMTETIKVSWSNIEVIGEDTVLVSHIQGKHPGDRVITTVKIPKMDEFGE